MNQVIQLENRQLMQGFQARAVCVAWPAWPPGMKKSINLCQPPFRAHGPALFPLWMLHPILNWQAWSRRVPEKTGTNFNF